MRSHLTLLDRAIVRLLDERARLVRELGGGSVPAVAVEDLLRRADGDFPAEAMREAFSAIERGCGGADR